MAAAEARFLRSLAHPRFRVEQLVASDLQRMADLVEQYADLPPGTTDASVVTLAERMNDASVATLDRRHFTVVRPRHTDALVLLP
jgi:predicted nucleic acid-binding protein